MRHARTCRYALAALLCAVAASPTLAEQGQLTLKTERVVVFKDGHALIIKRATGTADAEGNVHTDQVPDNAVLGSFWAVGRKGAVLSMRAEHTNAWRRSTAAPALGNAYQANPVAPTTPLASLLGGVKGKTVTLVLDDGKAVTGQMLAIINTDALTYASVLPAGSEQPVTIALRRVVRVEGDSLPSRPGGGDAFVRAKRLSFVMGKPQAGKEVELTLMYFTPGLRWIPTYRLSGDLKDSADMALQAEVLNEVEDLHDVALDLVVGVPHFRFGNVISPLSLEGQLRNTLHRAAPQLMGQMSNAMYTQRAGEHRAHSTAGHGGSGSAAVDLPKELAATGEQDLFFYSVPNFSLKRGGRATLPLWQATAPAEHLYTLDLKVVRHPSHGGMVNHNARPGGQPVGSPLRLLKTQVWHQLDLTNNAKVPWTTGAAMILRNGLPVGQDLLTYTPPKGTALLPMTVAVNVRGSLQETELERESSALRWAGSTFARIKKQGTVTVTNFTKQSIRMRITAHVPGKAAAVSDEGALTLDDYHADGWYRNGYGVNNHSELSWDVELEPGQTIKRTYTVEFYVR